MNHSIMSSYSHSKATENTHQNNLESLMEVRVSPSALERICKKTIEVILYCLPNATKGTIYSVGSIPEFELFCIASGHRSAHADEVVWDLVGQSDHAPLNEEWRDYLDHPEQPRQGIAWCLKKQQSWTSDGTHHSLQKMKVQKVEGDYHHLEPVLVKKTELWGQMVPSGVDSKDNGSSPIWRDSKYATVALIRVDFLPRTVKYRDRSTQIIKYLSRSLGTEMLALHAREMVLLRESRLEQELTKMCNDLAHDFRNIIAGMGFAHRAINNEISYLRESWEYMIHQYLPDLPSKRAILAELQQLLASIRQNHYSVDDGDGMSRLIRAQYHLLEYCLLPEQSENWLEQKIKPLWQAIFSKVEIEPTVKAEVEELLDRLRDSFYACTDKKVVDKINHLPRRIKQEWLELSYKEINLTTDGFLERYIELLDQEELPVPRKRYVKKNIMYFKQLIKLIPEVERRINNRLQITRKYDQLL